MSCIKDTYMEYSLMSTNNCNLKCSYCINKKRRNKEPIKKPDTEKIINHILTDVKEHKYEPVVVTFYGGEPLIVEDFLMEIIEGLKELNPLYNLFTNGTLISENNFELLNKMQMISISIDGEQEKHDLIRGRGSFDKTLNNYLSIKDKIRSRIIAFITLTPKSSLYKSVMGIEQYFSDIFWFLENSEKDFGLNEFLKQYDKDLDLILKYWIDKMNRGIVRNFIPFQGLYDIIEKKHVYTGLPCDIGENFQAIAIDGSVYSCEDSYHNKIGNIETGVNIKKARENYHFPICKNCEIKNICAGRCVIPHINYRTEKIKFYCKCSKLIINKFIDKLPYIKDLIKKGIINEEMLNNKFTRFTDVIP